MVTFGPFYLVYVLEYLVLLDFFNYLFLPDNEVKMWKGQHNDSQKSWNGSMKDGFKHVFQRYHDSAIFVAYCSNKTLENTNEFISKY